MNSTTSNTTILKAIAAAFALLVLAAPIAGLGLVGTASAASTSYTVSGTVTTQDGTAVSNATVEFVQNGTVVKTVQTGSDGTYSASVANGTYTIEANKAGYSGTSNPDVSVQSDKTVGMTLFPAFINGIVADGSGAAVSNATVEIVNASGTVVKTTTTDSGGSYSVAPPSVGTYTVQISKSGYVAGSKTLDMTQTTTYDATLAADSDGDGIADSNDAYPTEAKQEYTVSANTSKTVESVYAEINATEEVTVTVSHNGTTLGTKTVTPSSAPATVKVNVSSTYSSYTVTVHGVSDSDVSSTGAFYASDSTGGATGGSGDSGGFGDQIADNPIVALIVAAVTIGAAAVIREEV